MRPFLVWEYLPQGLWNILPNLSTIERLCCALNLIFKAILTMLRLTFGRREERLDLLDEFLDGLRGALQLLLVGVQGVPEVRRVLQAVRELERQEAHREEGGGRHVWRNEYFTEKDWRT